MKRATSPVLALMLLAACTTHAPSEDPGPIVTRRFVGHGPVERDTTTEFSRALEPHGIRCPSFDGSIWGSGKEAVESWGTSCSGTEQQWRQAESAIARLTADGFVREISDKKND